MNLFRLDLYFATTIFLVQIRLASIIHSSCSHHNFDFGADLTHLVVMEVSLFGSAMQQIAIIVLF